MKSIPLRGGKFPSKVVIKQIAELGSQQGMNIAEMRMRMRILDALEPATDELRLEDADHNLLVKLVATFPFAVADAALLRIADDIEKASPA